MVINGFSIIPLVSIGAPNVVERGRDVALTHISLAAFILIWLVKLASTGLINIKSLLLPLVLDILDILDVRLGIVNLAEAIAAWCLTFLLNAILWSKVIILNGLDLLMLTDVRLALVYSVLLLRNVLLVRLIIESCRGR